MNPTIQQIAETILKRQNHLLILDGNVYDHFYYGPQLFADIIELIVAQQEDDFPQCLLYDIFSGVKVIRGNTADIQREMGLSSRPSADAQNADLINQLRRLKSGNSSQFPINPLEIFPCFDQLLNTSQTKTLLIIDSADSIVPTQVSNLNLQAERALSLGITKWSHSQIIRRKGHLIILVCRRATDLKEEVLDRIFEAEHIRIPKPDENQRESCLSLKKIEQEILAPLVKATSGLSLKELDKLALELASESPDNLDTVISTISRWKKRVFQQEDGDILDIMIPKLGFEAIGALEKPITELKFIAQAVKEGRFSLVPMGVLLEGPPGTGKTILVEAFAKDCGLNVIKPLDIMNMWLGESERRMSRFLNAVTDKSPVAVFIDELDQNQGQRGGFDGDSGTSRRIFKKMLEVTSDVSLRGRIIWFYATNRPDLIDPALKRPGRCDLRIPLLPYDTGQLAQICQAALKQYPDMRSKITNWVPYTQKCAGHSGASMVEIVRNAWVRANRDNRREIAGQDMEWAAKDFQPQILDRPMIARSILLALMDCSSRSLRPDNWEKVVEDFFPQDYRGIINALNNTNRQDTDEKPNFSAILSTVIN